MRFEVPSPAGLVCASSTTFFDEGQAFGYDASDTSMKHTAIAEEGGCQVVRVTRQAYARAQSEGELDTFRVKENGEIVSALSKFSGLR